MVATPVVPQAFVQPAAPAPIMRPVAPTIERPAAPISGVVKIAESEQRRGQGGAYYVMLTLLIGLSIFTLYLYQKKMNSAETPHIAATVSETIEPEIAAAESVTSSIPEPIPEATPEMPPSGNPFIETTAVEVAAVSTTPAIPETAPETLPSLPLLSENIPEPASETPPSENSPIDIVEPEIAAAPTESAMPDPIPEDASDAMPGEDLLAEAGPQYQTSDSAPAIAESAVPNIQQDESASSADDGGLTCDGGGGAPDANGCCPGETFDPNISGGACCPNDGSDCFPVMIQEADISEQEPGPDGSEQEPFPENVEE
jgi:hypothetical protein